jgi:site-specific recombinase
MPIFRTEEKKDIALLREAIHRGEKPAALMFLRDLVDEIRPSTHLPYIGEENLRTLLVKLDTDADLREDLSRAMIVCLEQADLFPLLTESGMALSRSMGKELFGRIKHKIIPPLRDEQDFREVIDMIFYEPDDYVWVEKIGNELWAKLFSVIQTSPGHMEKMLGEQVVKALGVLSVRVAQLGYEPEVFHYMPDHEERTGNPFLQQQLQLHELHVRLTEADRYRLRGAALGLRNSLADCYRAIRYIRTRTHERGASLSQTFILYQLDKLLGRITLLSDIVDGDDAVDIRQVVEYFIGVVRNQNRKYSIREFLSQTTGYLAYQIAEQKGLKGNTYITTTKEQYRSMLFSAMKGGLIVSFVAIFKNLIGMLRLAPFWQGLSYSLNYSAGFILIDQTGSTLATKQPAFTANAVAGTIDGRYGLAAARTDNLMQTMARVSRSQLASFAGNLLLVFPLTFLLAWIFDMVFGFKVAEGAAAWALLRDQHPFQSLALLYACNTGVFLFLSGIIAGYVQNKMIYGRISERIIRHRDLQAVFSANRLQRIAAFWGKNAGSVIGSIALGFFLGMAGLAGRFFGIPFDIRHITISAGNASIGLYGIGYENIPLPFLVTVFCGVFLIGMLNFLVSFSLAFYVAMRSRGLRLKEFPPFLKTFLRYFAKHPMDFIRAPR